MVGFDTPSRNLPEVRIYVLDAITDEDTGSATGDSTQLIPRISQPMELSLGIATIVMDEKHLLAKFELSDMRSLKADECEAQLIPVEGDGFLQVFDKKEYISQGSVHESSLSK
jgi:hypothetical protein